MLRGSAGGMRKELLRLADLQSGAQVLDVGCGTGTLAIEAAALAGSAGRVIGIDPAPEMIERSRRKARGKSPQLEFRTAAVEALPFADGEFEVVLSSLMLHHLPRETREQGLREIRRVLKPGGRLVVMDIADPDLISRAIGHHMPAD